MLALLAGLLLPGSAFAADAAELTPSDAAVDAPVARHGSAFVDPLGFLLFGPTFGVEAGSGHFSATLYGRWLSSGVLAHRLFLKDNEAFAFSYGAGLRGRYFLGDNLAGPHLGAALEFVHTRVDDSQNLIATKSNYIVPLLEAGYRLPISSFYLGGAAGLGYAFKTSTSVEDLPGGRSAAAFEATNKSTIYGSASLEVGVYF